MKAFIGAAALIALIAGPVHADCPYPAPPDKIPDGNTATLSEMVAVKKQVSDYNAAVSVYLDCIEKEHDDAVAKGGDKMTDNTWKPPGTTPPWPSCRTSLTVSTNRFGCTRRKTPSKD